MKELFERYDKLSQETVKILEKSIETVQSGRSPSESFCDQLGTALRDLRSAYTEIVDTLPKKASGATAPEKASVKQLEAIWQNVVNEKRRSLRAPLEEFIRVYSDDAWYLEAIQDQLAEAKKLLAQMEADEDANPDVSSYLLFVECVKQDLHQNEKLAHSIGKGIEGFPVSAVMGLTMNKYYIRDEAPAVSDDVEEKVVPEEPKEPEEVEVPSTSKPSEPAESVESEKQEEPVVSEEHTESEASEGSVEIEEKTAQISELKKGLPDSVIITIKNDTQEPTPKSSKYINKAKEHKHAMSSCLNYLMVRHLISCKQVNESTAANLIINKADMDYLISQGYIGTVCINVNGVEEEYYAPSSKACAYFKKADVANYIKQRIPGKEDYPTVDLLKPLSSWDPLFIYRCKLIVDYLVSLKESYVIRMSRGVPANNYAYCNYFRVKGKTRTVATVRLSEDDYQSELKMLYDYLEAETEADILILLVEDLKEIEAFCNLLSEKYPNAKEKIKFVLVSDPEHFYDHTGSIVEKLDGQEDAEDQENGSAESGSSEKKEENETLEITEEPSDVVVDNQEEPKEEPTPTDDSVGLSSELPANEEINDNEQDTAADVVEAAEEQKEETSQEQDEIPTFEVVGDDTAYVAMQNLLNAAYQAFSKGLFHVGMTILHGLELEDERYHRISDRYGFALGDPYLGQDNRFANLQSVYNDPFGQDEKYDFLACAAYLRMYCSPTAGIDPYSVKDLTFLKDNIACSTFKPLNDLLNSVARYVGRYQHGLDDKAVASAAPKQSQLSRITECTQKAKEIQDAKLHLQTRRNVRINKTRWQLFSENSEIQSMLSIVAGDKRTELGKVKAFLADKGIGAVVEDDVIDTVMQSAWDDNVDVAKDKKADPLKGAERSCLMRQLRSIFECLSDWAAEVESGDRTKTSEIQDTLHLMEECRAYLTAAIKDVQKKTSVTLPAEDAASYVILLKTAETILERLEGKSTQEKYRRNFYIDLLKAPYVALDDERMLIVEGKDDQIYDLDFCNRAALYLDDAIIKRDWRDVVKKIFTYSQDRKCFNFGCVEIIRKYLEETGQAEKFGEYNTAKAIAALSLPNKVNQSPSKWREDYIARFEMAKSDEWFEKETIDSIEERVNAQKELYFNANNFGIYGQALQRMIDYFDQMAQKKKPEYQHQLDLLKEKYEELQGSPIVNAIQASIDKLRFGEAISFLDQANKGNFDIIESNVQPESRRFDEFRNRYPSFYENAREESGLSLEKAFTESHPTVNTEDYQSAVTFLKNWPHKVRATKANIEAILRSIGQESTLKTIAEKEGYFLVKFDDPQDNMSPHPIAEYGSIMYEKGLQVAVVEKASDLEKLTRNINSALRSMDKDIPALLLVDTAIHLDIRSQLAKAFMSSLRIYTFIILDRVMALNIAEERKSSRWNTLLCCAVPFQPVNPYSDDPNNEIPKEMFFGRVREMNDIINTKTATLVYGGRQLGKTALLHQARNLSRFPLQKKWASYVAIKDKKGADAAKIIGDTLLNNPRESFFRKSDRKTWTWKILISMIRERMTVPADCKDEFFLLIDEADAFLKDSAKHNYEELEDLLQIVTDTNNRFRFVLAGLRDVVRFHRGANANNSIVSKFKQLPIKPLDFKDARQLLVKPLSYLGYTFSDEEGDVIAQILHSTNYFPGIIHFYAHKLIEKKQDSFNASSSLPFKLNRNDMLLLLKDKDFLKLRKSRLEITLELDEKEDKYYNTLALLLSYYNYESIAEKGKNYSKYGATPLALLECAKGIEKDAKISKLTEDQLTAVLEELCDLYILRGTPDDEGVVHYDFARTAFADMLGRKDDVQTKLVNLMAEGGHDDD